MLYLLYAHKRSRHRICHIYVVEDTTQLRTYFMERCMSFAMCVDFTLYPEIIYIEYNLYYSRR